MYVEIAVGSERELGSLLVRVLEVSEFTELLANGKTRPGAAATISIAGEERRVVEGSVVLGTPSGWRVVRVRVREGNGLVRFRPQEDLGRFRQAIDQVREHGGSHLDIGMGAAVVALAELATVLERIDEHPDSVGRFAAPLASCGKKLQFALDELDGTGASTALRELLKRELTLAAKLYEIVQASTQEVPKVER